MCRLNGQEVVTRYTGGSRRGICKVIVQGRVFVTLNKINGMRQSVQVLMSVFPKRVLHSPTDLQTPERWAAGV